MLNKLKSFSDDRGYIMIDQWGPADIREFRSSWNVSARTAPRRMSMVRSFFEYCHSNEWIDRNPARMVKNPKTRDSADGRNEQKLPFSDDEIKAMYEACPKYGTDHRYKWTGEDLADFISISIYTGLRISDVALFRADRMQATGELLIRTTKAGTHVYTWVPEWLQERIKDRAKKHGQFIFGAHKETTLDASPLPAYIRPHHLTARRFGKGRGRPFGKFGADGPQALCSVDTRKAGAANEDFAGRLRR